MKPNRNVFVYIFIILPGRLSFMGLKTMGNHEGKLMVQVELDGSIIESVEMPGVETERTAREIRIDAVDGGYNIVKISADGVEIMDADCPVDYVFIHPVY